ncbi:MULTISPECIES: NfeD family protein [unclassified Pseudactinotalea]|uniref:NfeD family protein n=1 Tax=unclassified Pseudactinotalea TaxID=2649176 RepID=UPI00128DF091|nr:MULTISPECIES: NfeD family protein [unclassified Pseudactinotalea]MPV49856.1 NfeD family protein [Pseudactinotalea sp. HY160]QGH69124.1 NfeD family protein [Pseudactinotalea sp. HY158]
MGWLWWVGLALVLGVIEMLTVDLLFLMLAGGALAGALSGALGAPIYAQVIIALVVAGLLLFIVRPIAQRRLASHTPDSATGTMAHVGRIATVVADVSDHSGRVKLEGEVWTARTEQPGVLPVGTTVEVVRIDGATAVVIARQSADPQNPYGAYGA